MVKTKVIGYSASLAEAVYELTFLRCRSWFYIKVEPRNGR